MNTWIAIISFAALEPMSLCGQTPLAVGESLPLYYDVRTGNVTIDTTNVVGGILTGYTLDLPPDNWLEPDHGFLSLSFYSEAARPFMDTFFSSFLPKSMGESNFSGVAPGVYAIGNILPPNLDEAQFRLYFGRTGPPTDGVGYPYQYYAVGELGSDIYHPFEPIYSPSPFPALNSDGGDGGVEIDWAESASLLYDPANGAVTIDTTGQGGGTIWSYRLDFADDVLATDNVQLATDGLLSKVDQATIVEIGAEGIAAGSYLLGNILPAGLSSVALSNAVTGASFYRRAWTRRRLVEYRSERRQYEHSDRPRAKYVMARVARRVVPSQRHSTPCFVTGYPSHA